MRAVNYYYSNVLKNVSHEEINSFKEKALKARSDLLEKTGKGNDFVGWVKWPQEIESNEVQDILKCSERLRKLHGLLR